MLAWTPVKSAPQRQTYCVVGKKLYGGFAFVMVSCSPESVIPKKTQTTQNAIEGPDDKSGPDVVAESAFLDEYSCVARSKLDLPRVSRMDIATDEEDTRVRCKY